MFLLLWSFTQCSLFCVVEKTTAYEVSNNLCQFLTLIIKTYFFLNFF